MAQSRITSNKILSIGSENVLENFPEIYDDKLLNWTKLENVPIKKKLFSVALIDNKLMFIGGSSAQDENILSKSVEYLDLFSGKTSTTSPMNEHRLLAGTAVVGEGKMASLFVFGGEGSAGYLHTVERWDPLTWDWSFVTPMTTPRSEHGVAVLGNEIYMVGGKVGENVLSNSVEAYNFMTDTWEKKAPMNRVNGQFGIASFKGHIYVVGGFLNSETPTNTVERYDPVTNSWTTISNISSSGLVGLSTLGTTLVCAGGITSDIVEVYDEENNQWKPMPSLHVPRGGYLVELPIELTYDKLVWIVEGNTSNKIVSFGSHEIETAGVIEIYDAQNNKWIRPLNRNITQHTYSINFVDDKLLMIGGTHSSISSNAINSVLALDLSTGAITDFPPLLDSRMYCASVVVEIANKSFLYVLGGWGNPDPIKTVERWDPIVKAWTRVTPMSVARSGIGATVLFGKIYVMGGRQDSDYHKTMEAYDVKSDKWEPKASMIDINGYFGVESRGNYIYVVGGQRNADSPVSSVERYDGVANSWVKLANIRSSRNTGVCSFNNRLIYAGGSTIDTQEYDEDNNIWTDLSPLSTVRRGHLIELPLNMKDYEFDW